MAVAPLTFLNGEQIGPGTTNPGGLLDTVQALPELLYVAYFGRAGDPLGVQNWSTNLINGSQTIDQEAVSFGQSAEAINLYPYLNLTQISQPGAIPAFIESIYENLFNRQADALGLAYWENQLTGYQNSYLSGSISQLQFNTDVADFIMDVIRGAQNSSAGQDISTIIDKDTVATFFTNQVIADGLTYAPGTNTQLETTLDFYSHDAIALTDSNAGESVASVEAQIVAWLAPLVEFTVYTLTINTDNFLANGNADFYAPLTGSVSNFDQLPTLTGGDSLVELNASATAVLNAYFDGSDTVGDLNIVGVQTWNINQTEGAGHSSPYSLIDLSADAAGGPHQIVGLRTLNFNDASTSGSLSIGDNGEPVQEPNGANGFTITATEAIGYGYFESGGSETSDGKATGESESSGSSIDYYLNGADGSGYYEFRSPGVDVDIAAAAFTGQFADATINVTGDIVGGFQETEDGSYIVPPPIIVSPYDGDDYNPNWVGYLSDAFSIAAGASAGPAGPGGAVGFTNWVVTSEGAASVGSLNIMALGGEGSMSAQTLTLINPVINGVQDSSNTLLYATAISDSLSTDWENLKTVNLQQTKGFVTLTGLETNVQEVLVYNGDPEGLNGQGIFSQANFLAEFRYFDGGGLLASDTSALTSILGGTGNSFYDLSSLTPAAANAATLFQGGSSTAGNSEMAFNNAVFTSGLTVNVADVQILDDVSSINTVTVTTPGLGGGTAILEDDGEAQGGVINMNDFSGLGPLNVPYALLAEDLQPDGGVAGNPGTGLSAVPFGLPFTEVQLLPGGLPVVPDALVSNATENGELVPLVLTNTPDVSQSTLLPPTVSATEALDLQSGVIPAGYDVLQLLNADGSTQTVLGAKLFIENAPFDFAINMQDTADGMVTRTFAANGNEEEHAVSGATWSGFDITIQETQPPSSTSPAVVNEGDQLILFVSDDGALLGSNPSEQEGAGETLGPVTVGDTTWHPSVTGSVLYVPQLLIQNYTTVDIVLPTESVGMGADIQDYVVLGGQNPVVTGGQGGGLVPGFDDVPVSSVQAATVNFFDNYADNGGSPYGGEDDLVLGYTNFTGVLDPSFIGITTVAIDTIPNDFSTTINDFSTGSLEIGATDVTNLNAQATSHLIMDLPATLDYSGGINVNGSLIGQNLLQGTSGTVQLDPNGHNPSLIFDTSGDGVVTSGLDHATVYEATTQIPGVGWGNDTLTGGDGFGTVTVTNQSGALSETFTLGVADVAGSTNDPGGFDQPNESNGTYNFGLYQGNSADPNGVEAVAASGNTGDNFFPEGGNDVVNIAPGEIGTLTSYQDVVDSSGTVLIHHNEAYFNFSTIWVGFYDVCNSAGQDAAVINNDNPNDANSGVGTVYDQAITDIPGGTGSETFVDGYGASTLGFNNTLVVNHNANDPNFVTSTPAVTINGFHFGGQFTPVTTDGDTIEFGVQSWASSASATIGYNYSSLNSHGQDTFSTFGGTIEGLVQSDGQTTIAPGFATYDLVASAEAPSNAVSKVDVILDNIGTGYQNAQALQGALATDNVGNITLAGTGVQGHTEVDILVAYWVPSATGGIGAINIADVTLTNTGTGAQTDTAALNPVVHDLVHIVTTVGLSNFTPHNIDFLA